MMMTALAVGLHVAQHGEELVGLLGGEHGGGLVQNEHIRAPVEHLDNLKGLLLGDGHVVDLLVWIHDEAVLVADLPHFGGHSLAVEHHAALFQAEGDVLCRGEHIHQFEVLMDHADVQVDGVLGRGDADLFAVYKDLALVREVDAGEHIHQCGLAAAVFAQQRQDLAGIYLQIHFVVGPGLAEGLGNALHLDKRCLSQSNHPFFSGLCDPFGLGD